MINSKNTRKVVQRLDKHPENAIPDKLMTTAIGEHEKSHSGFAE